MKYYHQKYEDHRSHIDFDTICQGEDQAEDDPATEKMGLLEMFLIAACLVALGIGIGIIICVAD